MKSLVSFIVLSAVVLPVVAVTPVSTGRVSVGIQNPVAAGNRNQQAKMASMKVTPIKATATEGTTEKSSIRYEEKTAEIPPVPEKDKREKEKAACIQNNIGVGNTFVWASRYSNINDYSTMVEDTENPENNTCFVKVAIKSTDPKIDLGDIKSQYFEMGRNITCGSWADENNVEKRILDAKKNVRTWATVGGAVGGAAIGVGSMELFGNRLVGGAVEGQKSLENDALLRSQLLVLKKDNDPRYNEIIGHLEELQKECSSDVWANTDTAKPKECEKHNYEYLLGVREAN